MADFFRQNFPLTAWLFRKLTSHAARRVFAAVVLLLLAVIAIVRVIAIGAERRAEKLLREVKEIRLSNASLETVERLAAKYEGHSSTKGDCTHATCDISVGFTNEEYWFKHPRLTSALFYNEYERKLVFQIIHRLGLRFYFAGSTFHFRKGRLLSAGFILSVSTPEGWTLDAWAGQAPFGAPSEGNPEYWSGSPGGCTFCRMIYTGLTPAADRTDIERALDVNVGCISQVWNSCMTFAEIMPSAAADMYGRESEQALANTNQPCSPTRLRLMGRGSDRVMIGTPTAVRLDASNPQYPHFYVDFQAHEFLRGSHGSPRRFLVSPIQNSTVEAPQPPPPVQQHKPLLVFADFSNIVQADDCGIISATSENVAAARKGVEQAREWGWIKPGTE